MNCTHYGRSWGHSGPEDIVKNKNKKEKNSKYVHVAKQNMLLVGK